MTIKDSKHVKIYSVNHLYLIFNKVNGYFEEINGNKYLMLLRINESKEKIKIYGELWSKVNLKSKKSGIKDSINHKFPIIRIDSYDSLPIEKILTFHNVIILIKSAVNKYKNNYYYNIFLEKGSYKDKSNTKSF